ncbi:MAG: hypothetical protein JWQ25_169 [Daejeonella sp.]|nr:hypothetical protein [Daejeonella sp.]
MSKIISSIACNLDTDILSASISLFAEERIGAIEWSFDTLYNVNEIPDWFTELITTYSHAERLIGHGVFFSIFSGKWSNEQQKWLNELKVLTTKFRFDHITEHFGFTTSESFHHGAPLSIPYSETTLNIGRDRLKRIHQSCCCPVGLENLAFSYSINEVKKHGEFLERLVEPINGFIILDLHNLYCQIHNFSQSYDDLIKLYPLERVREIHISGGSWEKSSLTERKIRRDTHDNAVPDDVFSLLEITMPKCPNLKYVVLEQMGNSLRTSESKVLFYNDYLRMESIIQKKNKFLELIPTNSFLCSSLPQIGRIVENDHLHNQQKELSFILETSNSYKVAVDRLASSSLANSDWNIENWTPHMLETAIDIAQKWKN